MNFLGRTAILMMASLLFLATQVHAFSITFGGVAAQQYDVTTDAMVNAGLTADKAGINAATNTADTANGWFIETFDRPDGSGGFTTLNEDDLIIAGGGYDIRKGSIPQAAAPLNDETFYAFAPKAVEPAPASVTVRNDYFYAYKEGLFIDYMGLYFGSVDLYNTLVFYLAGADPIIITGSTILAAHPGSSPGNQLSSLSNVYVNLNFDLLAGEVFTGFTLSTTQRALEIDNIVTHVTTVPTPEPSTFILLGAGFLGLAALGRKRFAQ